VLSEELGLRRDSAIASPTLMTERSPFRYFKTSPEIIRLAVMLYVRFPLSLRNVEDLLHERGVDVSHETVRFWRHRFGPLFASEIRKRRV
jgi:putative transposase